MQNTDYRPRNGHDTLEQDWTRMGMVAGGLAGALIGLGIPEEEARYFETGFHKGGVLVTVNTGSRVDEAVEVLQQHGGDLGVSTANMPSRTKTGMN
jgi:hypothetical protein